MGVGLVPQQVPPGCGAASEGTPGPAPGPAPGAGRALPPPHRSLGGDSVGEKVPGKCPPPRTRGVLFPPRMLFPRPAARCGLFRPRFSQGRRSCSHFNENPGG